MATSIHGESETDDFDTWSHAFDEKTRRELTHDDQVAFRNICGVLIGIVSLGLLIGVVAVLAAM